MLQFSIHNMGSTSLVLHILYFAQALFAADLEQTNRSQLTSRGFLPLRSEKIKIQTSNAILLEQAANRKNKLENEYFTLMTISNAPLRRINSGVAFQRFWFLKMDQQLHHEASLPCLDPRFI